MINQTKTYTRLKRALKDQVKRAKDNKLDPEKDSVILDYLKTLPSIDEVDNQLITPEVMKEKGFKYLSCRISGADSWQGLPFWEHPSGLVLRGSVSRTRPARLMINGFLNSKIETIEDLNKIISLFIIN